MSKLSLASMICYLLGILLLSKTALAQTTLPESSLDEPTTISTASDEPTAASTTSFFNSFNSIPTVLPSVVTTNGTQSMPSESSNDLILDPREYSKLIKLKNVPGTENSTHQCLYVSTPRPGENRFNVSWDCEAGYYCLGPNAKYPCTAGFLCPNNSSVSKSIFIQIAQPVYCCEGYYCSRDTTQLTPCPSGYFCTLGTVDPISCHYLALCPLGSSSANKYFVVLFVLVLASIILILLHIKRKSDELKRMKYQRILHEKRPLSERTLGSVPKYFDIEFENLSLVTPMGIEILKGVSGKFLHGRTCAIMGPSGAGKTTFVSLLTGKVKRTSGKVKVNGVTESLEKYQKLIGFVPQEDIMLRELTVREILVHSALMRLPSNMERAEKKRKVIEIIKFLGLDHVMDSVIGDEEERGISGGQRKRVNIGMELVAEPSILFLDEPTSGLDSVTSFEVCTMLKSIAHQQGLTIAAIIHSPSPQAFDTFDDFMLLGKGGMIIYFGERDKAMDYFTDLGYESPPFLSPSDFMMEIASGKVHPRGKPNVTLIDLHEIWKGGKKEATGFFGETRVHESNLELGLGLLPEAESRKLAGGFISSVYHIYVESREYVIDVISEFWEFLKSCAFWKSNHIRETPNVFITFVLLFKRSCLQLYRNRGGFMYDQSVHLVAGLFISFAISNQDYIGKVPQDLCSITPFIVLPSCLSPADGLQNISVFMALGATFCGINAGTATFGYERVVYWRDTAAGMRTVPYFLAKVVADIPRILLASLMYSLAFILFYAYRAPFYEVYLIVLLCYMATWAMGYFLSSVVPKEKLGLAATGLALACGLVLNGATPRLELVMSDNTYKFLRWLWFVSAQRWIVEAFYLRELSPRAYVFGFVKLFKPS
ncbi:6656_t:CDS:10 [Acaulospora morrowiae]|uniref:6656_t:CDS:1 n=1 Tax=Acaulospora morrowiae TaxID=94023 RepID=A0A9N8V760_9GLOM|nr:6656_t:CDS:10 [Acaulospora morrowiae]